MNPIQYLTEHSPPTLFAMAVFFFVLGVISRDRELWRWCFLMGNFAVVIGWCCILSMQIDTLSKQRTIEVQVERLLPTAPQQSSEAERVVHWAS